MDDDTTRSKLRVIGKLQLMAEAVEQHRDELAQAKQREDATLAAAWYPLELNELKDLHRLASAARISVGDRAGMTAGEILDEAIAFAQGSIWDEMRRMQARAEAGRPSAIDGGGQGGTTISGMPHAMTSDAKQAAAVGTAASDDADTIATSPSGRVQLLKPSAANAGGKSSKRPCYAIVDGCQVKLIETQFVALLHVLNELQRGSRPTMHELEAIESRYGSCQDGYRILKRMAQKEPWRGLIDLPGESGRGIGIH